MSRSTAGILLIGNELLTGKVRDLNSHWLAGELFRIGVVLRRAVTVPDESTEVVEALRDLCGRVDYVFTSGGIGPTHDDITMAAVAKAFGRELEENPRLVALLRGFFGPCLGEEHLRMARVPRGCVLIESAETRFPVIAIDKVYVLAGVPEIFKRGFGAVRPRLHSEPAYHVTSLYLDIDEWSLAPKLDLTVSTFPEVAIGSYPEMSNAEYRVRITFEAGDRAVVESAADHLSSALPAGVVVRRGD